MGWLGGLAGACGGGGDYFQKERDRVDALRRTLAGAAGDVHDPEQLAALAKTMGFEDRDMEGLDLEALAGIGMPRETQRLGAMHSELGGLKEGHQIFEEGADIGHLLDKYDLGEVGKFGVERRPGARWAAGQTEHHPGLEDAIEGRVGEAGRTAASTTTGAGDAETDLIIGRAANEKYTGAMDQMNRDNAFATSLGQSQGTLSSYYAPHDIGVEGIGFKTGEDMAESRANLYSSMYQPRANKQRTVVMDPETGQLTHAAFDPGSGLVTIPDYGEGKTPPAAAP